MDFLRRAVGNGDKGQLRPITTWPGDSFKGTFNATIFEPMGRATVEVAGESHYQGTLEVIAGGRTINGARKPDHLAMLVPEPRNPYDPNAVRVYLGPPMGKVGYLSREDAVRYRPVIERVAWMGRVIACRASLKGGWDRGRGDSGSFGVTLHLGSPTALMLDIDKDHGPDPRWPSPVAAPDGGRAYNRRDCPYCGIVLDPLPKAKKKCPGCSQPVYVQSGPDEVRYLLRECDLAAMEAGWEARRGVR
jgi:HIRAN domain